MYCEEQISRVVARQIVADVWDGRKNEKMEKNARCVVRLLHGSANIAPNLQR